MYDYFEGMPCRYDSNVTCFDSDCSGCPVLERCYREDASQYEPDDEEQLPYDPYAWMY